MKTFPWIIALIALASGCAHQGGMQSQSYRTTGRESGIEEDWPNGTYQPFPSRMGPGEDRPRDYRR